jgi:streptogramin lyase
LVGLLAWASGEAASGPQGIAVGADGNLWFTEFGANQVGRITTAGVVTELPAGATVRAVDIV